MKRDIAVCRHNTPLYRYCAPCEENWPVPVPAPPRTVRAGWLPLLAAFVAGIAVGRLA